MYNSGGPAYFCVKPLCTGWKWVATAQARKESACRKCGTPFCAEAIKIWPPLPEGGKGKGKGRGDPPPGGGVPGAGARPNLLQGGKGGGATNPRAAALNHLQGGKGGPGLKPLGLQPNLLQGSRVAKGAQKGGSATIRSSTSKAAKEQARLEVLLEMYEGDHAHPAVVYQQAAADAARKEEEDRMSPTQRADMLKKELDDAQEELAANMVRFGGLVADMRGLEEKLEDTREAGFGINERIRDLQERIQIEEAKIERKPTRATGEQVSMAPVDTSQRKLADILQYVQDIGKTISPTGLDEAEMAPLRETLGLAWGQICTLLDPPNQKVPSDSEDDMQDAPNEQRAAKAQRKQDQDAKLAARMEARLRGDDMSDDENDNVAEAWTRIGTDAQCKEFESYCRQLQVRGNEVVAGKAERLWKNRTQSLGKAKAKAKARGIPSSAGQPSPSTPLATQWDARSGRASVVPPGQEAEYPPLQACAPKAASGTPAHAPRAGIQSPTRAPSAAGGGQSAPTGDQLPAQGTGSVTAASSASVAQSGTPAAPPAEGPGVEGGDGSPA